ncbi:formyltransferase family protein [Legionella hackeliae]|uniref:Putative Methionyl-tRNA formyltransferase n=1 Tax=Legionella hackeliae TaxID=449 RepID=A0A0A8US95_LEGHA|nr:formyltransferase family protein [Legionella hackeliae]KTD10110.1 peptide synthetase, non-ribosomal [Legionella hackeliae]CEK09599.1 putative Methionyl-tRNA formyltransferase [Legionella hackeliae]STX49510.1 peptide synthetase, non-ribosomal [Legionella hackeliae]
MRLTCILMGQDNLLIQCGNYLLENHHQIKWVISPVKSIQTWCEKNDIPWVTSLEQLPEDRENLVDYLFSIVNGVILKEPDLKIARFGTINYHDSILPKYAGVNATSWALIHGETTHGITWHMVNDGIDEGDIVYQSTFQLSKNETALTLNLRCFDEATNGFVDIIEKIQSSSLIKKKQNTEIRSYFGLTHPLPDLGFINWETATAQQIDWFCRALNFGNYSNNLGTLKLYLKEDYLIVLDVEKSTARSTSSQGGVILAIDGNGLLISTRGEPVLLKKLITPEGKQITADGLIQYYGLKVNHQLPLLNRSFVQEGHTLYSKALKHEKFWLAQLTQAVDHTTYCDRIFAKNHCLSELVSITIDDELSKTINNPTHYLLASVFIYLYRLNNYENSTVFLSGDYSKVFNTLWADLLPMTLNLQDNFTCNQVLVEVGKILKLLSARGSYLSDIYARQPSLKSLIKECVITCSLSNETREVPENSLIHFDVEKKSNSLRISHRLDVDFQGGTVAPLVERMSAHINNILQYLLHHPETSINKLVFLTEEEQEKLFTWGVGKYLPLPSNTITDLFEQSVCRSPDSPAVYQGNQAFTYYQLWQKAEKITTFINTLNLPSQSLVGISVEPGVDTVALILGIAKTGCICAPISREYSAKQINTLATALKIDVIIRSEGSGVDNSQGLFSLYTLQEVFAQNSASNSLPNLSSADKPLILFITGENGSDYQTLTHKNIINYSFWLNRTTNFTAESIFDVSSSLPLTIMFTCLLAPLFVSGALAMGRVNPQTDGNNYLKYLQVQKISHLRLTTADWELLLGHPEEIRQLSNLSYLLLTADITAVEKASEWLSMCPNSQFIVLPEAQFQ